jgi:predicted transposase YbfD/YdcC
MPAHPSSLIKRLAGKPAAFVVPAALAGGLAEALATLPDPRRGAGRRFRLVSILLIAALAVTCDADGFTAIHQWACDLPDPLKARLGLPRNALTGRFVVPSEKRIRTLTARVDPGALLDAVGRYACHRLERAGMPKIPPGVAKEREARRRAKAAANTRPARRRALAADGKTLKGSGRTRHTRTHLVGIVEHDTRRLISRATVDGKRNETPALRDHLELIDLDGALLTADAAHTCRESAQKILERGGHYLLVVKPNQPLLYAELAAGLVPGTDTAWAERSHRWEQRGHGRTEQRILRAAPADGIDFPGAGQITMTVRRRRTLDGRHASKEIVFAITSLTPDQATPEDLAHAQQGHWSCEMRHHVLDTTFDEDRCQARTAHAPENLSTLRDLAIEAYRTAGHTNTAHARRHYTHQPERVFDLYEL